MRGAGRDCGPKAKAGVHEAGIPAWIPALAPQAIVPWSRSGLRLATLHSTIPSSGRAGGRMSSARPPETLQTTIEKP